jgi:hypothetical protein
MSLNVSWRSVVVAAGVLMAAVGGAAALTAVPAADAQQPSPTSTGVLSNFVVNASNGYSNLPEFSGSGDGVVGAACTGASPRSGPNIPAQVITTLRTDLTYLRILHNTGTPLTGDVRINCVLEVETTPQGAATLQQLQAAG